jgi:error-prone DNA polymerase
MGFYHPATLVKDAQRRGVRFAPIDVQVSNWNCVVQDDGVVRLGLRYVKGLREEVGKRIEGQRAQGRGQKTGTKPSPREGTEVGGSRPTSVPNSPFSATLLIGPGAPTRQRRFKSIDELTTIASLRQDELRALAEVGALASFGGNRRTALWQAERAGRPAGPLLMDDDDDAAGTRQSPLPAMSMIERVRADYDGTGLTIGPHPMALARASLAARGVMRAIDLPRARAGRRVRTAGAVITRQRPGTAKGFVFLSLEDETGIANVIVTPDTFAAFRRVIVDAPYLLVEGVLQNQSGAVSVKADRIDALSHGGPALESHDFH